MPHDSEHPALLSAAQRELAIARLAFLRDPSQPLTRLDAYERLIGVEGQERLHEAARQGQYSAQELALLPQMLAELARSATLHAGRRSWGRWLGEQIHGAGGGQWPLQLLGMLAQPASASLGLSNVLRALGEALDPHVGYWLDLEERAAHAGHTQLTAAERALPRPAPQDGPQPPTQVEVAPAEPAPSLATLAGDWLDQTDDAARELGNWLVKQSPASAGTELARLWLGLRAAQLDGLSRPQRRFYRLAEGARRLGFERDMNAGMHGELAKALLLPLPACVATAGPFGVRVLQPGIEYGWLSDLAAAQGLGEGLALTLVSPALSPVAARPGSVSRAFGGLFLQLRAEPTYLQRVESVEPRPAGQLARQAALWLLFRVRLAAAVCAALAQPARSQTERRALLVAAGERALGRELPEGVLAACLAQETTPAETFEALLRGCELHAALRERYDSDFFLNPRVSEVLRGAAARGRLLEAADWTSELSAQPHVGVRRLLELLG